MIEHIHFRPLPGLRSPHLQTVLAGYAPGGTPPPSSRFIVHLTDGDRLCCEVSTPSHWKLIDATIVMIHGLGGCQSSSYMRRIGRKLYAMSYRVIRVNLRGCGSGRGLARSPYHAGISTDILEALKAFKQQTPQSPLILIGFSLGGNIALKLLSELGSQDNSLLHYTIAVCPPIDLARTVELLNRPLNRLYHRYYLRSIAKQGSHLIGNLKFSAISEFDNHIIAPHWGFLDAQDYYQKCSSKFCLPNIQQPCRLLFAVDDPFVDYQSVLNMSLAATTKIALTPHGGHMGFFGWAGQKHHCFWLDRIIIDWIHQLT